MDSKSDSVLLSYKDNPELKAALGGKQPGDTCEITLKVTVRANDDDTFDALIDEIHTEDESSEEEMDEMEDDESEDESEAPVMVVMAKKNGKS